jgi:hypothetical protein
MFAGRPELNEEDPLLLCVEAVDQSPDEKGAANGADDLIEGGASCRGLVPTGLNQVHSHELLSRVGRVGC